MNLRTTPLEAVLSYLEISLDHPSLLIFRQPSQPALTQFKNLVRKQRRELAKKYHPDINPDQDKMKLINDLCDQLLSIKLIMRPPPVQIHVYSYSYGSDYGTTTSSYWSTT